jgi:hypothetical protein
MPATLVHESLRPYDGSALVRHTHAATWYAVVGLSAAGVAACAGILGIEDRSLDTQGDASTVEGGGQVDGGGDTSQAFDGGTGADGPGGNDGPPGGDGPTGDAPGPDGGTCPDPCVLATGLNHPFLMTSDSANAYWTEFGDALGSGNGKVSSCPVTGCSAGGPTVIAQGLTNPRGIAVDAQNVYFGTATYSAVNGAIWSCPLAGCNGSPHQLAPASIPFGVAVDSAYVYWVDFDLGEVHRVAKTGGGGDVVLYDAGAGVASQPEQCVVDALNVYFTDSFGDLFRVPVAGGVPAMMAGGSQGGGWPVVIDTANAYLGGPGQIVRMPKSATDGGLPIATGIPDPNGLAIDLATGTVYWSNWGAGGGTDGTVGKAATDGGSSAVLSASLITPEAVAVSGSYVLWISNGKDDGTGTGGTLPSTGALLRTAK